MTLLMGAFPDAVVQRKGRVDHEKKFFARDVSRLIAAGERRSDGTEPHEADKERADRLRDAFSDLTGKRVTRTSAGTIGKLLNSRLAGRPVFVDIKDDRSVDVVMTLTTPNCPAAGELPTTVENAVASVPGVGLVSVNVVWEPVWSPERMSDEARLVLNMW